MTRFIKLFTAMLLLVPFLSIGQNYQVQKSNSSLIVSGTSTLHDWHEEAEAFSGTIELGDLENLQISKLSVSIEAESLKSGKSAMDKNTYKALNTKKYKNITFELSEVTNINKNDAVTYTLDGKGVLTITGVSKTVDVRLVLSKENQGINLTGSKTIKMSDFGIDPPKALFGTITTGDEVTIKFNMTFN